MARRIILDPSRIRSKEEMNAYMRRQFGFEEPHACTNLDALADSLSEVTEETEIILTSESIQKICADEYAYKVLLALGNASMENPNLHIRFRQNMASLDI